MLHKLHGHCLPALLVLLPQLVIAASEDRSVEIIEDAQDAVEARGQEGQWVPIPVANPTLGTGIQAVLMYLHPKKAEDIPNTTSGIAAMYTSTDSWFVGAFSKYYDTLVAVFTETTFLLFGQCFLLTGLCSLYNSDLNRINFNRA